jgi:hypothetical protein
MHDPVDIIEQVREESERIVRSKGMWECSVPLAILYADALEVIFTRARAIERDQYLQGTGTTTNGPTLIQRLLAPMEGR